MKNYQIVAKPNLTNVICGKLMSFSLQRINPNAPALKNIRTSWMCFNHFSSRADSHFMGRVFLGPRNTLQWNEALWNIEGQHKVVCEIKYGNKTEYAEHIQNVINIKQSIAYSSHTDEESENPFIFYENLTQQIAWIREQEKQQHLSAKDEKAYQNRMKSLELFKEKLKFLLDKIPLDCRENFRHVAVKHISSIYKESESISLRVGCFHNTNQVYLIDWTNPIDRIFCGVYVGKGDTLANAANQAIACWNKDNRYPEGIIKGFTSVSETETEGSHKIESNYTDTTINEAMATELTDTQKETELAHDITTLPNIIVTALKIDFETDGESNLDTLSNALSSLALVTAVVAGVITLVAPVPGSRVVSALIWSSIAASTTSAVINIADRHSEGFGDWVDDSIDTLTIVANAFSAGTFAAGTKWASKALTLTNLSQKQVIKLTLIGQISADSLQGIIVTEELAQAIYSVMNNQALPADIKLSKVSALISRGIIDGVLTTVSIHGSKKHFTALKNESYSTPMNMDMKDIEQYIKGEKSFRKINIEEALDIGSELPAQKTEPPREPNRVEPQHYTQSEKPKMVGNLANNMPTLMSLSADIPHGKVITVKLNDDNGEKKLFSAILPQEWQLLHMDNYLKPVHGDYLEAMLSHNLAKGKESSSFNLTKEKGSGNTELDSGVRKGNTNEPESKTKVSTNHATKSKGQQELEDILKVWKSQGVDPLEIKSKVALAETRCAVEGVFSEVNFYNLKIPSYKNLKKKEVGIIEAIDTNYYRIIDVEKYMELLKESYEKSFGLFQGITPAFAEMHPTTERLIREFIANKKQFRILDGLPGTHAEVLSTNNVFQQLEAKGKNVDAYLDKIEVSTIRLTEYEQGKAFPACRHCSGILSKSKGINIPTGRIDD